MNDNESEKTIVETDIKKGDLFYTFMLNYEQNYIRLRL